MIIRVKVKPNSNEESLTKKSDNNYYAELEEPPENNKANIRLINILAKYFNVSVKSIKIKNPRSRNKIIEINTN